MIITIVTMMTMTMTTMKMMLKLEQALGLSAMHPTQYKMIGDNNDDIAGEADENQDNDDNYNNDDDVGIGTGGNRAFGNAPNSMQNDW